MGSLAAPLIRDPAVTPQRVPQALTGFFPGLVSATKFVSALRDRLPPGRHFGRGRGGSWPSLRAITFSLSQFIGFQGFSVRLFQQAPEPYDDAFGDVAYLHPVLIRSLFLSPSHVPNSGDTRWKSLRAYPAKTFAENEAGT